jgi:lysylphosphatidylglycerol synthetase-like protein (DUF2156 family)
VEIFDAADAVLNPGPLTPHEKLAVQLRKHTSHRIRFRPRTRAIFVFIGAIAIIISWLTPWYNSLTWRLPSQGLSSTNDGYELTHLSAGDRYAKYGRVAWSKTFTGQDLTSGPAALRSIAFSSTDFYTWVALALLALIAIWTFERQRQGQVTSLARRWIYLVFESGKVLLLVYIVARCIWKGYDLAAKAKVNEAAQRALFGPSLAPAAAHYVTNYSFGLTILPIGLIFAALGVISGDKHPESVPKVRVKAQTMAIIAIVFIAVTYGLFNG